MREPYTGGTRFSGYLLISDFDGTFWSGSLSPGNAEAVRYFQSEGGRFTIATGRDASHFAGMWKPEELSINAPLICLNGARVVDTQKGKVIHEGGLDDTVAYVVSSVLQAVDDVEALYFYLPGETVQMASKQYTAQWGRSLFKQPVYKILFYVDAARSDSAVAAIQALLAGQYAIARSWINGIELTQKEDNKGTAARMVADLCGAHRLICVGDYENDIPMLTEADIGYAVANASPATKAAANRLTVDYRADAIAAIIEDLKENTK